jgi:phosphate transport system permease protein
MSIKKKGLTAEIGPLFCWISMVIISVVCIGLILYPLLVGAGHLSLKFFLTDPEPSIVEELSGGIRTPIVGTLILIVVSTIVALPFSLATAIYLAEYIRKESRLSNTIKLGLEVLAGVPSIVFAIFGLATFGLYAFSFLSTPVISSDGATKAAFGRSFLVVAVVMAMHILPFVIKVMEESIRTVPDSYRHAAAALGATKWSAIRRVVLLAARPGIVTAVILGMGLVAGDTAIVWLCLGGSMTMTDTTGWWLPWHWMETLRNTGSTLTTYVYYSSPAGQGNAPNKAFGAAFILMLIMLMFNVIVDFIIKGKRKTAGHS